MKESELQKQVQAILRLHKIPFLAPRFGRKTNMTVGWPDITFALWGTAIAFELKTSTGKLSEEQERIRKQMEPHWKYYVIRTVEEASRVITEHWQQ